MINHGRAFSVSLAALLVLAGLLATATPVAAATCSVDGISFTITKTGSGTIDGTPDNDVILGSAGPDVIQTFAGTDVVCASDGPILVEVLQHLNQNQTTIPWVKV